MILGLLIWHLIGSFVWLALYCAGFVQRALREHGRSRVAVTLASIAVVVAWPVVAGTFLAAQLEGRG